MSSNSKTFKGKSSFDDPRDAATDVDRETVRDSTDTIRDTAPDLPTPAAAEAATLEEPADPHAFGFEESVDTEVDFDALNAVRELEAGMAAAVASAQSAGDQGASGESYIAMLESEVLQLNTLLAQKDDKVAAAAAEREKSRARVEREAGKAFEMRTRKLLLGFLEVLDDLDRALASARAADGGPAVAAVATLIDGVELVHKRFLATLREFGVSHRPAMGERFDPNLHHAVSMVSVTDPEKAGVIVGVVAEGYDIAGETLRPAAVAVGKIQS